MIEQFAVIVGLLSAFSSGREAKSALEIAEFQSWLAFFSTYSSYALII